jgi:hypothetical protein
MGNGHDLYSTPFPIKVDPWKKTRGVSHFVALPFTLKISILRQKKNYENSNISPCKNIIFFKNIL